VVVVGAGLAGLACTRRLAAEGVDVLLVEAASAPGGRVRTDRVDGFRADRGFQLLNPSYPEARRVLNLAELRLQPFPAGVVLARGAGRRLLADPRRTPVTRWPAVAAAAVAEVSPAEGLAAARWVLRAATADPANLLAEPDEPWGAVLDRAGVTGRLRRGLIDTFLAGTLGEGDGTSSRRFVDLLVRSFLRGTPSVPWSGMQALPDQLAAGLPAGVLRLGVRVRSVAPGEVRTEDAAVGAQTVVVAADPPAAARLTGLPEPSMRGLTTFWHVAPAPPTRSAALHVDGDRRGPVVNTVVISNAARSYSPDDRALVASTVLGADAAAGTEAAVRRHLSEVYGTSTASWELLITHAVPRALTVMEPPLEVRRPVDLGNGLMVAGDHRDTASIQGALVSGRRAADAALRHLGRPVPARPPIGAARAR
jgi:phytoene dehydrogenase-like protein